MDTRLALQMTTTVADTILHAAGGAGIEKAPEQAAARRHLQKTPHGTPLACSGPLAASGALTTTCRSAHGRFPAWSSRRAATLRKPHSAWLASFAAELSADRADRHAR